MRTFFKLALLLAATCTMFGCAHNYYNIPQETLEKKVRVIGIAPIFADAESDIRHPEKASVVALIQDYNARNEKELIARLRSTGTFYSVRQVEGDPSRLFSTLLASRERRDDAGIIYNKFFFKKDELNQILSENGLDAIMFVTVSGLTRRDKVYSCNFLSYLETDYNYLTMTAQMVDRNGNTIWEYPNFRRRALTYPMFFSLQYPDFDEATANLSEKVDVKFKTVAGVAAALAKSEKSAIANGPQVSSLYSAQFDEMISLLKTYQPLFGGKKEVAAPAAAEYAPVAAPAVVPAVAPVAAPAPAERPAAEPAPAVKAKAAPVAEPAPAPLVAPGAIRTEDIVPEAAPAK